MKAINHLDDHPEHHFGNLRADGSAVLFRNTTNTKQ
jgi:hypothetical protein